MRLNRPTEPRLRRTPNSIVGVEYDTTTSRARRRQCRATPSRRRPVAFAAHVAVVVLVIVLAGPATHAHADPVLAQQDLAQQVLAQAESVDAVLANIRNWLVGILAALATAFLTLGGVRYVYHSGDPGEVEKAKQAFKAAGIGYGIAALAPLIVTVLQSIVGM